MPPHDIEALVARVKQVAKTEADHEERRVADAQVLRWLSMASSQPVLSPMIVYPPETGRGSVAVVCQSKPLNASTWFMGSAADFVHMAYHTLLDRPGDAAGMAHYTHALTTKKLSRVDVLGRLRFCAEGRRVAYPARAFLFLFVLSTLLHMPWIRHARQGIQDALRSDALR